eukprot:1205431-Heterocapsa_arctica.AAC.1
MGLPYVAPTKAVVAPPRKAQGINALAALAQGMLGDPNAVPSAAPKIPLPLLTWGRRRADGTRSARG